MSRSRAPESDEIVVFAPGRVNLIGDHTDYTGGLAFPMAIQRGITVRVVRGGNRIVLRSEGFEGACDLELPVSDPSSAEPAWCRYVAAVAAVIRPERGITGSLTSDLDVGGLSSSAALEVGVALALGFEGSPLDLAGQCQKAEHLASGVPCGIMDQLAIASARAGSAMLIDCATNQVTHVPVPESAEILVVHSGQYRELRNSAYAERRMECERAEAEIGPLRQADPGDVASIGDPDVAARARHVITENRRVTDFASALGAGELAVAGELMAESHRSLRDDFAVSTPELDELVESLSSVRSVYGARLTGAGFGGAVIALCESRACEPLPPRSTGGEAGSEGLILGGRTFPGAFLAVPSPGAGVQTLSQE